MADLLPDDIICNIVARLPEKALLRFRCSSKHWNRVLREPFFMRLRSRTKILVPLWDKLCLIGGDVPVEDIAHSVHECCYPLESPDWMPQIVGTINGLVLLDFVHTFILYNPFTRASIKIPNPEPGYCRVAKYGFGHGANADELKIVRFRETRAICDVFSFKKRSWSSWSTLKYNMRYIIFQCVLGKFLNGFLHWLAYQENVLIVLNVEDMVLSEIRLPFNREYFSTTHLGKIDGCLCTLKQISSTLFDMWVMNEYGVEKSWCKRYSFTLAFDATLNMYRYPLFILDSGIIVMTNPLEQLVIYDPSNDSYKMMNISVPVSEYCKKNLNGVEYVESLISPSEIMCVSDFEDKRRERNRKSPI